MPAYRLAQTVEDRRGLSWPTLFLALFVGATLCLGAVGLWDCRPHTSQAVSP